MKLELNEKNEIISYLKYGGVEEINFTEFNGVIPDDFEIKFKPSFFMLQDDQIIENPDYVEPTDTTPVSSPTSMQEAVNKLGEVTAKIADDDNQIKLAINKLGIAVADLQTKEVK